MRIKEIIRQHRRDMKVIFECEHCGWQRDGHAYDDARFHNVIIPSMECLSCGKKAGKNYRPLSTKYPEGFQV